ncbi:MAG: hypothetical protein JSW03_02630, partial [Candidatus Eiseniibacteriota bacterium]
MDNTLATVICLLEIGLGGFCGNAEAQELNISFTDEGITVDGVLDEPIWKTTDSLTDFRQHSPHSGEAISLNTVMRATYDRRMIFFAFECDDPETDKISASASRDGPIGNDDSIVIVLDTFNDKSNAFVFAVNSVGAQFDARLSENGGSWDLVWNGDWLAACKVDDAGGWIAEIGIPFDEIPFDREATIMGFNAVRNIPRNKEEAFLVLIPSNCWQVSAFGEIIGLDLSTVESEHYVENREKHFSSISEAADVASEADDYILEKNLFYKSGTALTDYEKERCFLDLYLPKVVEHFPVMVWFHGGSLERCSKD